MFSDQPDQFFLFILCRGNDLIRLAVGFFLGVLHGFGLDRRRIGRKLGIPLPLGLGLASQRLGLPQGRSLVGAALIQILFHRRIQQRLRNEKQDQDIDDIDYEIGKHFF